MMHGQPIIKDNFSSMIIINTNGDDCPVDPDDNKWQGRIQDILLFKKNIFNYSKNSNKHCSNTYIGHFSHIILLQSCKEMSMNLDNNSLELHDTSH
jgi:hypothetical protein